MAKKTLVDEIFGEVFESERHFKRDDDEWAVNTAVLLYIENGHEKSFAGWQAIKSLSWPAFTDGEIRASGVRVRDSWDQPPGAFGWWLADDAVSRAAAWSGGASAFSNASSDREEGDSTREKGGVPLGVRD